MNASKMGWRLPLEVQKAFRKEIMNIHEISTKIMDFYVFYTCGLGDLKGRLQKPAVLNFSAL